LDSGLRFGEFSTFLKNPVSLLTAFVPPALLISLFLHQVPVNPLFILVAEYLEISE